MANSSKNKGDAAEREAVAVLKAMVPDLVHPKAERMLGAGRMDDVGDLRVFEDVAVQVRCYKKERLGIAMRSAAHDSVKQAANGDKRLALGMVPIPQTRKDGSVRWLACCAEWPYTIGRPQQQPIEFKMMSRMIEWLRDDEGPHGYEARPRHQRIAVLTTGTSSKVYVAPIEAWLAAYYVLSLGGDTNAEREAKYGPGGYPLDWAIGPDLEATAVRPEPVDALQQSLDASRAEIYGTASVPLAPDLPHPATPLAAAAPSNVTPIEMPGTLHTPGDGSVVDGITSAMKKMAAEHPEWEQQRQAAMTSGIISVSDDVQTGLIA